jgi:hypothetical protein
MSSPVIAIPLVGINLNDCVHKWALNRSSWDTISAAGLDT